MSQNANLQESYSTLVEEKLRATSVFANLFNQKHDGAATAGAVKIPVRTEATVGAYDIANGGTLNNPTTSYVPMICDNDLYVNELVDGFVAAAVPDGMVAERLDSAGFALADKVDTLLATLLTTSGNYTPAEDASTTLTKTNVYGSIVDAIQAAVAAKVAKREIWVAVSPKTYGLLVKSSEYTGAAASISDLGGTPIAQVDGCPVYESANLTDKDYIVGNNAFCHYVADWAVPVAVKDLADGAHIGASAVQGRQVCGFAVSKAATVIVH